MKTISDNTVTDTHYLLTDQQAWRIASAYQAGGALWQLATCGTIREHVAQAEINDALEVYSGYEVETLELNALHRYVNYWGDRGAVATWPSAVFA